MDENETSGWQSVNFVEVAMLGRACEQSLLSLKCNFVC